jgi:TRAP transporter TAXI family solute receptor
MAGLAALSTVAVAVPALPLRAAEIPNQIVIHAGKANSQSHALAMQFAEAVGLAGNDALTLQVEESQGSIQNVMEAATRGGNYIFTATPGVIRQARRGEKPFQHDPRYKDIRALFAIPFLAMHWVVHRDSGIKSLSDLAGLTFIPGARGSFGERQTAAVLKSLGLENAVQLIDIDAAAAPAAFLSNQVVGFALADTFPVRVVLDLANATPIRLLGLSKEEVRKTLAYDDSTVPLVIPGGTYPGIGQDVTTLALPAGAYTTQAMSDSTAYAITKAFWSQRSTLAAHSPAWNAVSPANLLALGTPLHHGALRYYAEAGIAVPASLK